MRYLFAVVSVGLVLSFMIQPTAAEDEKVPAAILLSCTGKVTIARSGGGTEPGTFGLALFAGDEVKTSASSTAEIHFEDGTWLQVGANSNMMIRGARTKSQSEGVKVGDESFKVVQNMMRLKDPKGTSTLAALRSSPGKPEIALKSPCQTRVCETRPVFKWESGDLDEELLLTIYDDKGIFYETKITGASSYEYPEGGPGLAAGISFSWTLETTDPLRVPPVRSPAAFFEIIPEEEATSLERSLKMIESGEISNISTNHFLRASVYFDHGLLEDAIEEMELALESGDGTKEMHSILARLYAEAGRTDEAMSEYDRLFEK